ncbi:ubiquitin carboxyl-terminal hydrolase 48-like [Suncus etruscus]|uniref:ubiquitin carboxyl-terminal hydrolase 48-like n=1 Tax=Suncus etruscus TaxID=109475 RepID=UPI0021101601|nr:ubiquitin carboxyl-terminal hydrolase 48-like [Suncus etruscus]
MAPKQSLQKMAWLWAETIMPEDVSQEHIEAAYRISLESCIRGICNRNCKGNPNCLVGIGEKIWLGEIDEKYFYESDDANSCRRKENSFVGLTNLGATCYVNTFLQVWFLNLEFRQAVYLCSHDYMVDNRIQDGKEYEPRTICEHLQYLFALMQHSNKRHINPSGFVKALRLNTAQQQDAQEFSKLFMSLLEDTLAKEMNPYGRNIVQQQFCGEYAYVTICNKCGRGSERSAKFYELELNIQGHKLLTDCISDFLKKEKLEGENRYFCECCQSKQNATRQIRLLSLPSTLNLQLMCFVFDRKTGQKIKLKTQVGFPEILDMEPYMEVKGGSYVYELSAILIHKGVSAYSGHYIAQVKDPRSGDWYKFNDEDIEKVDSNKLKLVPEDGLSVSPKFHKRMYKKENFCCRNAYMLVYQRKTQEKSMTTVPLPAFLKECVDRDNAMFKEWCLEMAEQRKQNLYKRKEKHEEVMELYPKLPAGVKNEPYEFVSLEWLQEWLHETKLTTPINNQTYLCPHNKLNPDKVSIMKRISIHAADFFYSRYGGGPRLTAESLCKECVVDRCHKIHQKRQLILDHKALNNMIKEKVHDSQGFWVGTLSLQHWRQLALEQINARNGKVTNQISRHEKPKGKIKQREKLKFNEDILCVHGDLLRNENQRRLVSQEIWRKLKYYFPKAPEFPSDKEKCSQCKALETDGGKLANGVVASEQKSLFLNLFQDKNRPYLSYGPEGTDAIYIVPQKFVDNWKNFIRNPTSCSPVTSIGNSALLCSHGGLLHKFDSTVKEDAKHVALIWPNEWEIMKKIFIVDQVIKIIKTAAGKENPLETQYVSDPKVCKECSESLIYQQQRDLFEYTKVTIYVLKVTEDKNSSVLKNNGHGFKTEDEEEDIQDDEAKDPDYKNGNVRNKRQRLCKKHDTNKPKQVRRSTRRKNIQAEKRFLVSANDTLKDLKIQIMHAFSIAASDLNLSYEGRALNDDCATLGILGIIPESIILLKTDEPDVNYFQQGNSLSLHSREEGFKEEMPRTSRRAFGTEKQKHDVIVTKDLLEPKGYAGAEKTLQSVPNGGKVPFSNSIPSAHSWPVHCSRRGDNTADDCLQSAVTAISIPRGSANSRCLETSQGQKVEEIPEIETTMCFKSWRPFSFSLVLVSSGPGYISHLMHHQSSARPPSSKTLKVMGQLGSGLKACRAGSARTRRGGNCISIDLNPEPSRSLRPEESAGSAAGFYCSLLCECVTPASSQQHCSFWEMLSFRSTTRWFF